MFLPPPGDARESAGTHNAKMNRQPPHREASLALLLFAAAGSAITLALAALVAGAGAPVALLAFASVFVFGLAADGRAESAARRLRILR